MTISNASRTAGPFTGNSVTTDFPFAYKVFTRSDLLVARTVVATGVETILVIDSDYTVILNPDQNTSPGGIIRLSAPLATGTTMAATSNISIIQPLDLTNGGGFYPKVINDALDRIVINVQQLAARVGAGALNVGSAGMIAQVLTALTNLGGSAGAALVGFGADKLDSLLKTFLSKRVGSIAQLRLISKTWNTQATATGYYAPGDGGGGTYYLDAADTTTADNGGTVIVASDGGRWKLAQTGPVGSQQFGAKGDYVQDDTQFLNNWLAYLTSGAATNQRSGYWRTGTYKVTGAGLKVIIADTLPTMITDGAESVVLKGQIPILIEFTVSGGSGMLPTVEWGGIKLDGVVASGQEGVRVNGLCFFTLKGWHFYNLSAAGRLYNLKAGCFTEGVVFEDCYFHVSCLVSLWYSVGAGTNSFRSSGLYRSKINIGTTAIPVLVDNGCVPYMAPMEVTLWNYRADAIFIQNNSTQMPVIGNVSLESFPSTNKLTLCAGSGYVFQIGGIIAWGTNSDKLVKGLWIRCREFFNAPDIGQIFLPDNTAGTIVSTVVGQNFSLPYLAGVNKPFQQNSAILTICVTAPNGYYWQGAYFVMNGATDNIVNASALPGGGILNNAGTYGAMTVSQGNAYNVNVTNANLPIGARISYSFQYQHGLIPQ